MHEASIVRSVIDIAENEARKHGAPSIRKIKLKVGEFRGVVKEALEFSFAALRKGTLAAEADLMTTIDADRISALGVPSYQITTGTVCHLDAKMVHSALYSFKIDDLDLLFIENVGNLVCPAEFYLGEDLRVMVYSTVEGADKPKKYPMMFHESKAVLLNKIDLLPYSGVSLDELRRKVLEVSPETIIFPVSCRTGEGIDEWIAWLEWRIAS